LSQNHPKRVAGQLFLNKELLLKLFPKTGKKKLRKADAKINEIEGTTDDNLW